MSISHIQKLRTVYFKHNKFCFGISCFSLIITLLTALLSFMIVCWFLFLVFRPIPYLLQAYRPSWSICSFFALTSISYAKAPSDIFSRYIFLYPTWSIIVCSFKNVMSNVGLMSPLCLIPSSVTNLLDYRHLYITTFDLFL